MKVSIIGVGKVGAALGIVLVARQLASELVLVGRNPEKTRAEALDLSHAAALGRPTRVTAGDIADTADSAVIILCVGGPMTADQTRDAAAAENFLVIKELLPPIAAASPNAVLILATNPNDAMTTVASTLTGFPPTRVIGTGTLLDTMRLRAALSRKLEIHPLDIRAYVLGEHGDGQFAAFSCASAGGGRLELEPAEAEQLEHQVRKTGYAILAGKGYTSSGIALATAEIVEAVLRDTHAVMPVSTRVDGFAGVSGVALSLPVVVGQTGVQRRINVQLSDAELNAFRRAAVAVRSTVNRMTGNG